MDCKKIGLYIQNKRRERGLTQDQLGVEMGVTGKAVSKWECGVALPDIALFNQLADVLNIDVIELLNGEDKVESSKNNKIIIIFGCIIFFLILLLCLLLFLGYYFINNYDRVNVYDLVSEKDSFYVEGKFIGIGDDTYLSISDIRYVAENGENFFSIYSFEYELYYKNELLYCEDKNNLVTDEENVSIKNTLDSFSLFVKVDNFSVNSDDFIILRLKYILNDSKSKFYDIQLNLVK